MSEDDDTLVLSSISPNGNIEAYVEQDDRVAFFYLHGAPETGFHVKSCWVRNLVAAPERLEADQMREGMAPLLPRAHCAHPDGAPPLTASDLRVVWFEEGDAAALMSGSEVLAIIPPWGGVEGFDGYAKDCKSESALCWPMPTESHLSERIERSEACWKSWDNGDPWEQIQGEMLDAYEQQLGSCSNYYPIDGGKWPPKALLRIPQADNSVALITLGMCVRPQPAVEMAVEDPRPYRRIELGMCLAGSPPDDVLRPIMAYLSGQSNYPWSRYSWLGHGHTFPCDVIPTGPDGEQYTFTLLLAGTDDSPTLTLPECFGDPVRLLWMVPITGAERDFAETNGSEALANLLAQHGVGIAHVGRPEISECRG